MDKISQRKLWIEAVATTAYLRNRVPNRGRTDATPYEQWFGEKPDLSHLRIFGSIAYTRIPDHLRRKLDPKAKAQRFVGYDWKTTKIYRVYGSRDQKVHRVGDTIVHDQPRCQKNVLMKDGEIIEETSTETETEPTILKSKNIMEEQTMQKSDDNDSETLR